jgi:hypothetical protein
MVSTVFSFAIPVCSFVSTTFIFISYCVYTFVWAYSKVADGKVRHPDWMSKDSPDEQSRPSGEWKNFLLTPDLDVELFHQLFSDKGDEQKPFKIGK